METWTMSHFDFSVLRLYGPCTVPLAVQKTMPENGLATAECDFTEKEAVWTGFLYGLI